MRYDEAEPILLESYQAMEAVLDKAGYYSGKKPLAQ